ncbi:uncharacterized protein [Lepeophtheirus salmonis]|uniref:uncharacterized protein n=1 Tax=Lepeophtheirus salmonis TaxID=72036 RepID=UPI001AE2881C|nr:uncharacterized protein LOC121114900 [Lepeophtheirus salmonis]
MAHTKKWEEAQSEFFQESYPSVDRTSTTSDLTAFLPQRVKKNHYSLIGVGTFSTNKSSTRTARIRAAIQGLDADDSDDDLEVLDFTDENLSTEDEVWNEIQKIKDMPISLARKKALKSQYQKCPKIKMTKPQKLTFCLKRCFTSIERLILKLRNSMNNLCSPPIGIQKSCGLDISMTFFSA